MSHTMTTQEAAATLNVHENTVLKLIEGGDLSAGKVGRAWVLLTRDVLAYAEKIVMQQTADRLRRKGDKAGSATKERRPARTRASSRIASSSGATFQADIA